MSIGALAKLIYGKETSWGSIATPTSALMIVTEAAPPYEQTGEARYAIGGSREPAYIFKGVKHYEGSISGYLQSLSPIGYTFGSIDTVDNGDGTYTHTVTPATGNLPSMTIELGEPGLKVWQYAGVVFNSLELGAEADAEVTMSINYIAKSMAELTDFSASITPPSPDPFTWKDATIKIDGTDYSDKVASFTFSINNNLDAIYAIGSDEVAGYKLGTVEYELSLELIKFDPTLYALKGSTHTVEITLTKGSDTITLTMSGAELVAPDVGLSAEDIIGLTIPFLVKSVQATIHTTQSDILA